MARCSRACQWPLLLVLLGLLLATTCTAQGEEPGDGVARGADAPPAPEPPSGEQAEGGAAAPDFSKMRVKVLRKELEERGVECLGCVEKDHFLEKLRDSWRLPKLSEEELAARHGGAPKGKAGAAGGSGGGGGEGAKRIPNLKDFDQAEINRIIEQLKQGKKPGDFPEDFKMNVNHNLDDFNDVRFEKFKASNSEEAEDDGGSSSQDAGKDEL